MSDEIVWLGIGLFCSLLFIGSSMGCVSGVLDYFILLLGGLGLAVVPFCVFVFC